MITRREFIKAFGALVGTGAIGSIVKPVSDVAAGSEGKAVEAEATNEVPVAIDRAAFNYYPISSLTTSNCYVDNHGQTRMFPGGKPAPALTWPA